MKGNGKDFVAYSLTDIGRKRGNNEDCFLYAELEGRGGSGAYLMAVADGMGGHRGGEVASRRVIEVLEEYVTSNHLENIPELLRGAIGEANRSIYEMSHKVSNLQGMGSTCTAMFWIGGKIYVAHVGDSRAYLVRKGEVKKLTKDHTVAEEMIKSGMITPEKARVCPERNFLLRAVGTSSEIEVDLILPINTKLGDVLVLCSDGLTEFVEEDEIREIVSLYPPDEACHILVNMANERGGSDNITVQVAKTWGSYGKTFQKLAGLKNIFVWIKSLKESFKDNTIKEVLSWMK
ncbi:MAG TPA: Stp1/IreP family PP2C-type Ser/Thr phosphatase [Thermodesulfobacteriota bacterium]|nr:Stp1/IreP family PP2C-type Ser/Thr phosphatase [Thermodesulfobacteriota bacterium]